MEPDPERLARWKKRCVCRCLNFSDCNDGISRMGGIVCTFCEPLNREEQTTAATPTKESPNKKLRLVTGTNTFERQQQTSTTTEQASPHKTLRVVTHTGPSQESQTNNRTSSSVKRELFRSGYVGGCWLLKDTFIGDALAEDLVEKGFPDVVGSRDTDWFGGQLLYRKSSHYDNHGELFCYWYEDRNNECCAEATRKKPVVLDLFAGAGGMAEGLKNAGLETRYAVEVELFAYETFQRNHQNAFVFQQDVKKFLEEKPEVVDLDGVDHIHVSPPCQGFSDAKLTSSPRDEINNCLAFQLLEAVKIYRPMTVSFENVKGMLSTEIRTGRMRPNKEYLQKLVAGLLELGYQIRGVLLDAKDYGVAQERRRVFLLASKKGFPLPRVPAPTHFSNVWDALGDLEAVQPVAFGQPVIFRGKPLFSHTITQRKPWPHSMSYLEGHREAYTVRRRNGMHHYSQNREITIRERARLQSFPDSYRFCGPEEQQCDQVGNAVPVLLAFAVGKSIMEAYSKR